MIKKSILVVFFALFTSILHADQYLCVADSAVGFSFNKTTNSWKRTNFKVNESKYVIAESKSKGITYQVTKMGTKGAEAKCEDGFNEPGYLFCSGLSSEFKFNRNNGRYIKTYSTGYFNVLPEMNEITDEESDTPYIEIGKCSPF